MVIQRQEDRLYRWVLNTSQLVGELDFVLRDLVLTDRGHGGCMRKFSFLVIVWVLGFATSASAQDPAITAKWPVCRLGKAPIAPGPPPLDAQVFPAKGGPVIMSEAGPGSSVRLINCRLPVDTPSYRGSDGDLRDVASNQPYTPVGWDASPPSVIVGPEGPKGDKGDTGATGATGSIGLQGPQGNSAVVPAPPVPVTTSTKKWGLTGSAMIGIFQSVPVGTAIERITGRNVCFTGRLFEVGVAKGDQKSSIWRATFVVQTVDDGSTTNFICQNCAQEVTTTTVGVKVLGVKGERVQRIKLLPSRSPVQLMVTGHVGLGHMSGRASQSTGPIGGSPTKVSAVGVDELFGSNWFPIVGGGVGLMGDFGQHWTYGLTAVGFEWPGIYYGAITVTYWFDKSK